MNVYLKLCLILFPLCSFGQMTEEQAEIINQEVLHLVNDFRSQKNVPALKIDSDLETAAKLQSDYSAKTNELTHIQSNNFKYSTPAKRVAMVKTGDHKAFYSVGENAAFTSFESDKINEPQYLNEIAAELFESWKNSKSHRNNMLNPNFKYYGFAVTIREKSGIIYAIQVFSEER
ncbi:CAP domain-containing protein [Brumimicrobium oceani]|uniref:SCP domain-containing protein n=1 Tax=Brumimicrobium oceani TaxID=2100725 RepID=A0A2U2XAJ3_9FLAO|nr:CAP domain-containing protein [Brumimicrobium oceani]PWH84819.1 hypothetical protein DIT68_12900 [Brumimicrobium oceani]